MDYSRADLADRLAAQYVLGTLRGPARRRFEALLPAHPALRRAVMAWQQRLSPLADGVPPQEPPDHVWHRIQAQLFERRRAPTSGRGWHRLALWRGISAMAVVVALALLALLLQTPPAQPPVLVVLAAQPDAAAVFNASFVASIGSDGRALVLRALQPLALPTGHALQLWAMPAQGAPRSLGLVHASGATSLVHAQLLRDTVAFAVSFEPAGGSPSGVPTGPIVALGKLQP